MSGVRVIALVLAYGFAIASYAAFARWDQAAVGIVFAVAAARFAAESVSDR